MEDQNTIKEPSKVKVLLLEDDPYFMESYRERLKRSGFEVFTEDDEDEGMDLALSCQPQAIILDISLPKNDDFDFLLEMKKYSQLSSVPVFILTDLGDEDSRRKGLSLGAKEYFVRDELSFNEISEMVGQVAKQQAENKR
jgi:DNA-binding response OmpR family regulator